MRHRTSAGSQIQFDRQPGHQVHRLARAYGLALSCIARAASVWPLCKSRLDSFLLQ